MSKTATYSLIESKTLGSATSSVSFASIPSTFTDLIMVIDGEGTSTGSNQNVTFRFNGETAATNYSETYIRGTGAAVASGRYSESYLNQAGSWFSGRRYNHIINIMDYANTTTYKSSLVRTNWAGGDVAAIVILWRATPAAINQMVLNIDNGNFATGTTFKLYGIQAGNA
jgi:hypothetical protein